MSLFSLEDLYQRLRDIFETSYLFTVLIESNTAEVGRRTPNKDSHSSDTANDEMIDVRSGELSPNSKGRKRIHDEIAKGGNDSTNVPDDVEDRPPSRAANGEPLGKKIRETPSPPREEIEKGTALPNSLKTSSFPKLAGP